MSVGNIALIAAADRFAEQAHAGQVRKYTGEPYIYHPREVAALVREAGGDDRMICAALLHDVVEDCGVSLDHITYLFGMDVSGLVFWLTDVSKRGDGNRAARKLKDREHAAQAPARAQTIKLADLISNTQSITQHDPAFAKVYLAEKRLLLDVLTKGCRVLHARAVALAVQS
jgi:(p)ppGpp synthase/HD superfamily hydrolase